MTSRPPRIRVVAFQAFYRLPAHWRRRLVRLGTAKYTVGAVVLVRAADAGDPGALLLLRQPPGRGWSLPGGLLARREHPAVGAARELAEETGIRVSPEEIRAAVPNAIVHSGGRWVDLVFEANVPKDVPVVVDGAEVYEAAWHPLDALPPLTTPTAKLLGYYDIGPFAGQGRALDD
ncbi:MAG TPA: NUDIX domain-containing protein [Micromonosporaceae bacterium]